MVIAIMHDLHSLDCHLRAKLVRHVGTPMTYNSMGKYCNYNNIVQLFLHHVTLDNLNYMTE